MITAVIPVSVKLEWMPPDYDWQAYIYHWRVEYSDKETEQRYMLIHPANVQPMEQMQQLLIDMLEGIFPMKLIENIKCIDCGKSHGKVVHTWQVTLSGGKKLTVKLGGEGVMPSESIQRMRVRQAAKAWIKTSVLKQQNPLIRIGV